MYEFLFVTPIVCFVFLLVARAVSIKVKLVDKPDYRKTHSNNIPLVGGIAIYLTVVVINLLFFPFIAHNNAFLMSGFLLVCIGILDDRYAISVFIRVIVQAVAAIIIMSDGVYISSFGNLWDNYELRLGILSFPVSLLAVWASVNAFNMIDGIDGLLGGLSLLSFTGLAICFSMAGKMYMALYCQLFISAIVPFILLNVSFPCVFSRLKIFMGDAGSTFLGFTVIWAIMLATEDHNAVMAPATAIWLIAVPLMDLVAVMFGRLTRRNSPFRPDRTHLHHLLINYGFSDKKTLGVILTGALLMNVFGIGLNILKVNELISLFLFCLLFVAYCLVRHWLASHARHSDASQLNESHNKMREMSVQ
ncbi:undecaprenyl-phosphate alpha-N-acetylglucosaminyl 1-phosphate transferase [Rahnella victoriana]|nr:undecaprenyl-phosphate alpha-N-acetylglucosaminyl 1-phosphate transferase [Rahnella victoriana]